MGGLESRKLIIRFDKFDIFLIKYEHQIFERGL